MSVYKDPIVQKLFDLIAAADGGAIKTYYHGDPLFVPKSDLPVLVGSKNTSDISDESNAEDRHLVNIVLTLIIDIRDYVKDSTINVHAADQKMYDIMEGRNANYSLKSTSIIDILRSGENLGNSAHIDIATPMTVDYGFTVGKRGENTWSHEAVLSINVFYTQLRV